MRCPPGVLLLRIAALSAALACCFAIACGAYDADLVRRTGASQKRGDTATLLPRPSDAGERDEDAATDLPPDFVRTDDDENATTVCGDGRVSGVEKCDIGIPADEPGACPTQCPPVEKCVPRVLNGTACQAECALRQLLCESGDGCCAGNCTAANDADCSASCGDGILQPPETCEERSGVPCMKRDSDCNDGDPCTRDMLTGTPGACNVRCAHVPITELKAGDGCCPEGANANRDDDCAPKCGNGVHEAAEECDGSEGCNAQCQLTLQDDQRQCLAKAGEDACKRCACMRCAATELACWSSSDAQANTRCADMLACSAEKKCYLDACYCGASTGLPSCLLVPDGVCRGQVEATAGSADPAVIDAVKTDARSPLGRAYAADQCRLMQCQEACR